MKNLKAGVGAVALVAVAMGLFGCGPQQSSTERDQQQISAESQRLKGYFQRFVGTYTGTATIQGQPKEISLYLEASDDATPDITRLQNTTVPSLKGQLLQCETDTSCFTANPFDETNANKIAIVRASYNPANALSTRIYSSGTSTCIAGTDCTPYYFDVVTQPDGSLVGNIWSGKNQVGSFKVTRR